MLRWMMRQYRKWWHLEHDSWNFDRDCEFCMAEFLAGNRLGTVVGPKDWARRW